MTRIFKNEDQAVFPEGKDLRFKVLLKYELTLSLWGCYVYRKG